VLLNDVKVVEQPVARRAYVEPALSPVIQFLVDSIEYFLGVIESYQQRAGTTLFLCRKQMMAASNRPRALAKSLGAKHLAANRANELFAGSPVAGAPK
jgi:hypothetical protein